MDHSAHAHMDHGGHNMHTSAPMHRCKMNMLWNTDIIDTCIVFRSWHVSSNTIFLFSCLAIVALCIFYEYLRVFQHKLDYHIALALQAKNNGKTRSRSHSSHRENSGRDSPTAGASGEEFGLLTGTRRKLMSASFTGTPVPFVSRALRAIVYGATVFISFFLMLVFMTYNAYLIASVVVGAALGHYVFGCTMNTDAILNNPSGGKGMACH